MKILIVDDDIFSIQGLEIGVCWEACGITQRLSASSVKRAREILQEVCIDIVICDIEMPNEDGIDLLNWIRDEQLECIVLFYSCHADFAYAQLAVKLNVFDYILKPAPYVEIETALQKAAEYRRLQINEKRSKRSFTKKENALKEKFIRAVLDGTIPEDEAQIETMKFNLGISFTDHKGILLLLHDIKQWSSITKVWNKIDVEFSFKNIAREIFLDKQLDSVLVLPLYEKYYLTVLEFGDEPFELSEIKMKCRKLNQAIKRLVGYGINSCIGSISKLDALFVQINQLLKASKGLIALEDAVISIQESNVGTELNEIVVPDVSSCYRELLKGNRFQLAKAVESLWGELEAGKQFSYFQLEKLYHKYTQIAFNVLEIKNINLNVVVRDTEYQDIKQRALWGPGEFRQYMEYLNAHILTTMLKTSNERDIVQEIKKYIERHLDKELSRKELADIVFLNPDYMSRVFSKEVGKSLNRYITERKIAEAKRLLNQTDVTVTEVSERIGIGNFSYFSKMFKRESGISPSEYKRLCQKSESSSTEM